MCNFSYFRVNLNEHVVSFVRFIAVLMCTSGID